MRALDRKVLRDFARLRGQLLVIGLVIAAGTGLYLTMVACLHSLTQARSSYYARERFAHVFATLARAPEYVADQLQAIDGVHRLQTRVIALATLDIEGVDHAVSGQLVSLPDTGRAAVNAIRLRSGRLPDPDANGEVVLIEQFALAHQLQLGASFGAVIDGRHQRLEVVGTALSPEFVYTLGPGMIFPDDQRFGVMWMRRQNLGPAFDMEGAFNDVNLQLHRDAKLDAVIDQVDTILARYGGRGARPRRDQQSHFFLESELTQLRTIGMAVPLMFLLVAAFLLNVVFGRILSDQRGQIAALKALGYSDREIAWHYAKLISAVLAAGLLGGLIVATWLGSTMIEMYGDYYRLPDLYLDLRPAAVLQVAAICVSAATLGTWTAIRRIIKLPPAEAMRPEAPALYRRTLLERLGLQGLVPPATAMVLRDVERRPVRRLLTLIGMAMAMALVVVTTFFIDAFDHAMLVTFTLERREDVQLTLAEPRRREVLTELCHLPGVLHAEGFRVVPVRLRHRRRQRNAVITGTPANATLQRVLDVDLAPIEIPAEGLVLSQKLADLLEVRSGETVAVEILEGQRSIHQVPVVRVAETYVGIAAFMDLEALCRLLRQPPSLNGAWLTVDDGRIPQLHHAVKLTPLIAGVSARNDALRTYQKLIDENLGTSISINIIFALIMALGILYNSARITLADQAHQLASLRVLGFRRREVAGMLLGELAGLTLLAIPLGMGIGYLLAAGMVEALNSEQLRIPLIVAPRTYAIGALTVLAAAAVSGYVVWRKLDAMDIIEVLKTRE